MVATSNSTGPNNTSIMSGSINTFPPCTAEVCHVDEATRQRAEEENANRPSCALTEKCVSACEAYGKICPCAARIASHAACDAMRELKENSTVFVTEPDFTYLNTEDIVMGEKLGEGGFSNVNHCVLTSGDEAGQEFAVKYLKRRAMVDLHQFKHGAADLAVEAYFLQTLQHPNIVKLHGVTAGSVESNVASGKECGFFIVVDRLVETLEKRIERWHEEPDQPSLLARFSGEYREQKKEQLKERIRIALAIADAMRYLHAKNIVFRDLKPDNVGFDKNGVLKIFDFGLAKELKEDSKKADGRYELTGNTGSRRYMAPEVAKEVPYDQSVDVYSFGILLWELCTTEKPFYGYSSGKHMQQVVLGGERPKMDSAHTAYWPPNLQSLIKRCWSPFSTTRPSFNEISSVLRDIMQSKEDIPSMLEESSSDHEIEDSPTDTPSPGLLGLIRSGPTRVKSQDGKPPPMPKPQKQSKSRSWGFASVMRR